LSTKGKSPKTSEYARRREENIARNKELLKMTMGSGYTELIRDLKNESASNKKGFKKGRSTSTKQADGQGTGMYGESCPYRTASDSSFMAEIPRVPVLQL
jgi:hypothetical protein